MAVRVDLGRLMVVFTFAWLGILVLSSGNGILQAQAADSTETAVFLEKKVNDRTDPTTKIDPIGQIPNGQTPKQSSHLQKYWPHYLTGSVAVVVVSILLYANWPFGGDISFSSNYTNLTTPIVTTLKSISTNWPLVVIIGSLSLCIALAAGLYFWKKSQKDRDDENNEEGKKDSKKQSKKDFKKKTQSKESEDNSKKSKTKTFKEDHAGSKKKSSIITSSGLSPMSSEHKSTLPTLSTLQSTAFQASSLNLDKVGKTMRSKSLSVANFITPSSSGVPGFTKNTKGSPKSDIGASSALSSKASSAKAHSSRVQITLSTGFSAALDASSAPKRTKSAKKPGG